MIRCSNCDKSYGYRVSSRYNPTFYHEPIFNESHLIDQSSLKCSDTYYSTALDTTGYNIKTQHKKKKKLTPKSSKLSEIVVSVQNNTKHQKQIQLYPNLHHQCNHSTWYDDGKRKLLSRATNCYQHGYSRERKMIEMSSDMVFYPCQENNKRVNKIQLKRQNEKKQNLQRNEKKLEQEFREQQGSNQENNHQIKQKQIKQQKYQTNQVKQEDILKKQPSQNKHINKQTQTKFTQKKTTKLSNAYGRARNPSKPTFTVIRSQRMK